MPIVRKYAVDPALIMSSALLAGQEDARRAAQARQDQQNAQGGRWGTGAAAEAHENAQAAQLKAQGERQRAEIDAEATARREKAANAIELAKQKAAYDVENDERTQDLEKMKETYETGQGDIARKRGVADAIMKQINGTADMLQKDSQNPANARLSRQYSEMRQAAQAVWLDDSYNDDTRLQALKGILDKHRVKFGEPDENIQKPKTPQEELNDDSPMVEMEVEGWGTMKVPSVIDEKTGKRVPHPTLAGKIIDKNFEALAAKNKAAADQIKEREAEKKKFESDYKDARTEAVAELSNRTKLVGDTIVKVPITEAEIGKRTQEILREKQLVKEAWEARTYGSPSPMMPLESYAPMFGQGQATEPPAPPPPAQQAQPAEPPANDDRLKAAQTTMEEVIKLRQETNEKLARLEALQKQSNQ